MLSPGIEDRGEVEVGNWAKHKKTFYSQRYTGRASVTRAREIATSNLIKLSTFFTTWVFFDTFHLQIMQKKK
jgi:hypothetical protein